MPKYSSLVCKIICLFLLIFGMVGCKKDNISIVKNGVLDLDKTVKVGDAFDNFKYFKSRSWKSYEGDQKRNIVEFEGIVDPLGAFSEEKERVAASEWLNELTSSTDAKISINSFILKVKFVLDADRENFSIVSSKIFIIDNEICSNLSVVKDILSNAYPGCLGAEIRSGFINYVKEKKKIADRDALAKESSAGGNAYSISENDIQSMYNSIPYLQGVDSPYHLPAFSQVIRRMFPGKFDYLMSLTNVSLGMEREGDYIYGDSCKPGNCSLKSRWVVNARTGDFDLSYIERADDGNEYIFHRGTSAKTPELILKFASKEGFTFR